ncbi:MAG TPA: diguanylate cyclase [Verrucomicrobiae bacterium]|nr:diguanylate cyclase [Verrucomicrobiae bacterium]
MPFLPINNQEAKDLEPSNQLDVTSPPRNGERRRILAAEDNPIFQTVLRNMLKHWGYEAVIARDGIEAWNILRSEDAPRLAILDWMMPGMDGVDLCRHVRAVNREPYIYIVLLTARTQAGDLVQGMEAGADDYLTKPFAGPELRVRLRAGIRILDLQEELMATREALREQATHDALTGLLNRAAIMEALQSELERSGRTGQPAGVMMADVDRFKLVNDTHGHQVGDAVLAETARRMKAAIRRYDSLGRYGGEEFLFVLPGCDSASAAREAERIRDAIAETPFRTGDLLLRITCSVGVSSCDGNAGRHVDQLIQEADSALYRAKEQGRNRVEEWKAFDPRGAGEESPLYAAETVCSHS